MPIYDLEALWEEHCRCEFETRDAGATMAAMVDDPYVNHIPTMTGGAGWACLKRAFERAPIFNGILSYDILS